MNAVRLVLSLWLALCCALAQADVVKVRAFDDIIESGVLKVAMYENFPPYSYQQDASHAVSMWNWRASSPKGWA